MSFLKPKTIEVPAAATPKVEAAPPPVLAPEYRKKNGKSQNTTFLGTDATPGPASGNMGGKTLLGM